MLMLLQCSQWVRCRKTAPTFDGNQFLNQRTMILVIRHNECQAHSVCTLLLSSRKRAGVCR